MWFGFQFNLSDSSDDDLYRLENYLHIAGIIFWCTQKKSSRGCLRARPDANANANPNANHSKTICPPPLKNSKKHR